VSLDGRAVDRRIGREDEDRGELFRHPAGIHREEGEVGVARPVDGLRR